VPWPVIKNIVRFFRLCLKINSWFFNHIFSLAITWVWILTLDPFSAFHLGLFQLHLYMCIPFVLFQKVQVVFHPFLD
jgi:hypothetical protein